MRKYILLAACIMLLFITTVIVYWAFTVIEPSATNLTLISLLSVMGYGGATLYYVAYRQWM